MRNASLLSLIRYELTQAVMRNRSLLVFPVFLLLSYIGTQLVIAEAASTRTAFNAWDILFNIFGNQYYIYYVMTPVYLFLVSDFIFDHGFGEAALVRIGSRRKWWFAKASTLLLATLLFLLVGLAWCAVIAAFVLPWESGWSAGAALGSDNLFLNPASLVLTPPMALLQLSSLLLLGWTTLGLITLSAALLTGKRLYGFAASMLVFFTGLITMRLSLDAPWSHLVFDKHLLFSQHRFDEAASALPTVGGSLLYWTVFVLVFFLVGLFMSQRRDLPYGAVES